MKLKHMSYYYDNIVVVEIVRILDTFMGFLTDITPLPIDSGLHI